MEVFFIVYTSLCLVSGCMVQSLPPLSAQFLKIISRYIKSKMLKLNSKFLVKNSFTANEFMGSVVGERVLDRWIGREREF